jgi:hypothetical protein
MKQDSPKPVNKAFILHSKIASLEKDVEDLSSALRAFMGGAIFCNDGDHPAPKPGCRCDGCAAVCNAESVFAKIKNRKSVK